MLAVPQEILSSHTCSLSVSVSLHSDLSSYFQHKHTHGNKCDGEDIAEKLL